MAVSKRTVLALKSYRTQAEVLVKNYILADPFIPYTSVLGGALTCKLVYDLTQLVSTVYFRGYNGLTKIQRTEWNNRGVSTLHAIFISITSLYFVFWSDLFSDYHSAELITFRNSPVSTFALGVSVGYFISDLGMIFWLYPSLGGVEYEYGNVLAVVQIYRVIHTRLSIIHHSVSAIAVSYSMLTGEGQLYTFMVLISEVTAPEINIRWYLDIAGLKRSNAYLINGIVIFFAWLVARILLLVYMFYHVYLHHDQVMRMHTFGFLLVYCVPSALATLNLMWFGKILKGIIKTIAKKQRCIL